MLIHMAHTLFRATVPLLQFFMAVAVWNSAFAEDLPCFSQGNRAYVEGNYAEAVNHYQACLEQGQSAALHYNLGNTYYQLGDTGRAVLHYQRALAINPRHKASQESIAWLRETHGLPQVSYGLLQSLSALLPLNAWTWLIAVGFWGACALVLLSFYTAKALFWRRLALLVLLQAVLSLAGFIGGYPKIHQGVALIDKAPLKLSPNESSPQMHYLQAGEMATAIKAHAGWLWVEGTSHRQGWISSEHFQKIWDEGDSLQDGKE